METIIKQIKEFCDKHQIDEPNIFTEFGLEIAEGVEALSKDTGANFYQEHFSLAPTFNDDSAAKIDITVTLNGKVFTASDQQNLLIQLESQNAPVIRGCGIGVCHQCHCTKKSGLVKDLLTGDVSDSGEQIIQLCISKPLSDLEMSI